MEKSKIKYLFQISGLFAAAYTACFYKNSSGAACTIFAILSTMILLNIIKKRKIKISKWHIFYGISGIVLSTIPLLFANAFCVFISKVLYLTILIKWITTIYFRKEKQEFVRNIAIYLYFVLEGIVRVFDPLSDIHILTRKKQPDLYDSNELYTDNSVKRKRVFSQIVIGIVLAVPVLFIVLLLLTSADAVFNEFVKNIIVNIFLGVDDVITLFKWLIMFVLVFMGVYGLGKGLLVGRIETEPVHCNKSDNVIGITFTAIFGIVYVLFCSVQITALLNTSGSMLPDGLTYAEYARQGFFQMLFVCIINVLMVLICKLKFEDGKALRRIMLVICVCTYIMNGSSAYRMILYINNYKLTFLRLLVLWALVVVAVVMGFVIAYIYNDNISLFEYVLVAVTVLFIGFAFMSPDRIITEYNISHMEEKEDDDIYYLVNRLSWEGADVIIKNADIVEENADESHDGQMVKCYCEDIIQEYENKHSGDIRKFNLSEFMAYKKAQKYLNDYYDIN